MTHGGPTSSKSAIPIPPDVLELPVSRQRKAQIARDRLGLCILCSKPRQHYAKYCDECHHHRSNAYEPLKKALNHSFRDRLTAMQPGTLLNVAPGEYRPSHGTIRRMAKELGYDVTFRVNGDQLTIIRLQ